MTLCSDCPPVGWNTDETRCRECPRLPAYDPTVQPFDEPFRHHGGLDRQARNPAGLPDSSGDLASAGGIAGVDITDHRRQVGMPRDAVQWRAFYNVAYPKLWGIETDDPAAVEAGLEIVVAPCMPEHAAKDIVRAWNEKNASPGPEHTPHDGKATP